MVHCTVVEGVFEKHHDEQRHVSLLKGCEAWRQSWCYPEEELAECVLSLVRTSALGGGGLKNSPGKPRVVL